MASTVSSAYVHLVMLGLFLVWIMATPVHSRLPSPDTNPGVGETKKEVDPDPRVDGNYILYNQFDDHWPILCPPDNWYSKDMESCRPCKQCAEDQIVTKPCYRFQDTWCARLVDLPGQLLTLTPSKQEPRDNDNKKADGKLWQPVAIGLAITTGIVLMALLAASVAFVLVWRRHKMAVLSPSLSVGSLPPAYATSFPGATIVTVDDKPQVEAIDEEKQHLNAYVYHP